jgi:hypothetical protein
MFMKKKCPRAFMPAYDFTFLMRPSDSLTRCAHSLVSMSILVLVATSELQGELCILTSSCRHIRGAGLGRHIPPHSGLSQ